MLMSDEREILAPFGSAPSQPTSAADLRPLVADAAQHVVHDAQAIDRCVRQHGVGGVGGSPVRAAAGRRTAARAS